jgi:uncharacterized membrane protein (DUF485 family)
MKYLKEKINIIFLPFLLLCFIFIPLYSFVRWLINLKLHLLHSISSHWDFTFPIILSFVLAVIFLRRRIKILNLPKGSFGHIWIASISIFTPTLFVQQYLKFISNPLARVHTIQEIKVNQYQRFYSVDEYSIDTLKQYKEFSTSIGGKNNRTLYFDLYIVIPFLKGSGLDSGVNNAWYVMDFNKSLSSSIYGVEREQAEKEFVKEAENSIKEKMNTHARYFEKPQKPRQNDYYINLIHQHDQSSIDDLVILEPQFIPLATRIREVQNWIFYSLGIGVLFFLFSILLTRVNLKELNRYNQNLPPLNDDLRSLIRWIRK